MMKVIFIKILQSENDAEFVLNITVLRIQNNWTVKEERQFLFTDTFLPRFRNVQFN